MIALCILIRRGWDFGACEFGLRAFSLGPPYEEFQKMADFGVCKLAIARNCTFGAAVSANVVR